MTSRKSPSADTHTAVFALEYTDIQCARRVERSLSPELCAIADDRTRVSLVRDGRAIDITIVADDPVALRAGTNTWLGLVDVAESAGNCSVS